MPDLRSPRVLLAIAWSAFQLYTAYAGLYDLLIQLPVHVAFAVALGFLTEPTPDSPEAAARLAARRSRRWLDGALALLALLCAAHFVWHNERLASRMAMVDDPGRLDVVVGVLFTALLLEASRRHIGPALVVLALAFVAYAFAGPWLPGFVGHGGETFLKLVDQQTLITQGIFRDPHAGLGHVHLPVRRLRQRDVPRRPAALLHRRRPRGGRRQPGRRGKGRGDRERAVRDGQRQRDRQRGHHGSLHHPADEARRLPAGVRRRGGGVRVDGRPAHPARHGGGRLHHGRDAAGVVRLDRGGGGDPRRPLLRGGGGDGPLRGRAPGAPGAGPQRAAAAGRRPAARPAPAGGTGHARVIPGRRPLAAVRRLLGAGRGVRAVVGATGDPDRVDPEPGDPERQRPGRDAGGARVRDRGHRGRGREHHRARAQARHRDRRPGRGQPALHADPHDGRRARAWHRAADLRDLHHHLDHGRSGARRAGRPQAGRPHVRILLRDPGRPHPADRDLDLRDLVDRGRRRVAHAVAGHDAGPVRLHHPVLVRLRPGAAADQRVGAAHRLAHPGHDAGDRHAGGRPHRVLPGADASVGAHAAAGRRPAADLPRRLERHGRASLLRRGGRLTARRASGRRHGGGVMAQGIRDFVAAYERTFPGEVVHVTEPVTFDYDVMALVLEYERRRRWPILLFEKVAGADMPIIANVVASRKALAWALGVPETRLAQEYARRIKDTIKPKVVPRAPFHERVLTGADLDLGRLPIPTYFPGDAGKYLTAGMLVARDPETG